MSNDINGYIDIGGNLSSSITVAGNSGSISISGIVNGGITVSNIIEEETIPAVDGHIYINGSV